MNPDSYRGLAYFLDDNDQYVSVVLPNKTKAFVQSYNIKTKNDNVDAKLLARMGLETLTYYFFKEYFFNSVQTYELLGYFA